MTSLSNESNHIGKKREYNELVNKIPESTEFNFVPKLLPHQKLFNVNTDPSSWSASALTQRYQRLLKEKKKHKSLFSSSKDPSTSSISTPTTTTTTTTVPYHGHDPSHALSLNDYIYHRTLSITIITYIQLIFRVIILSILLYIVFHLIWTIQEDFQIKANDYTNTLIQEIQSCAQQYKINLCDPETRVPALEKKCEHWLTCMNRIPHSITRTKVSAETIAEIINSFVEPISYKDMFFFLILVVGSFVVSNITFGFFRKSSEYHTIQPRPPS
ncbi:Di-sulfide bridge nucleocytoplasmic transport domain-containing protein [Cunninghamella echinulata]|nr:Di-sulfide bridge nucleocytoplasmic transport domain-containing protein [Cunninghamella echinulata]